MDTPATKHDRHDQKSLTSDGNSSNASSNHDTESTVTESQIADDQEDSSLVLSPERGSETHGPLHASSSASGTAETNHNTSLLSQVLQRMNPKHCLIGDESQGDGVGVCGKLLLGKADKDDDIQSIADLVEPLLRDLDRPNARHGNILNGKKEIAARKARQQKQSAALNELYKLTDRDHKQNRLAVVCTTRFNVVEALLPYLSVENLTSGTTGDLEDGTGLTTVPPSDRRKALLLISNLAIPVENKAVMLLSDTVVDQLLPALLRLIRARTPECYLAVTCLFNLSYLEDAKVKLLSYVSEPTDGQGEARLSYKCHSSPTDNPYSLLRTLESLLRDYSPYLARPAKPSFITPFFSSSGSAGATTKIPVSVQSEAVRWSIATIRNLVTVYENARIVATTTIIPSISLFCLRTSMKDDLSLWTRDSLEDAALMLLVHLVRHGDDERDKGCINSALKAQLPSEHLEDAFVKLLGKGGIHEMRANAIITRLQNKSNTFQHNQDSDGLSPGIEHEESSDEKKDDSDSSPQECVQRSVSKGGELVETSNSKTKESTTSRTKRVARSSLASEILSQNVVLCALLVACFMLMTPSTASFVDAFITVDKSHRMEPRRQRTDASRTNIVDSTLCLVPISKYANDITFLSQSDEQRCFCIDKNGVFQTTNEAGTSELYTLGCVEDEDLPDLARFVVSAFGAEAIRLSQDLNAFERAFMKPAAELVNNYSFVVAYAEVLAGLKSRLSTRLKAGPDDFISPPDVRNGRKTSRQEKLDVASSTSVVLAIGKKHPGSNWHMDLIASVELRLQPCDAKIPFTLPWLDKIERRLGALFGIGTQNASDLQPYLSNLCVDDKFRGKGLGRALVRCVEDISAKHWGYPRIYLHVDTNNEAAYKLYKSEGYRDVGHRWNPFWAGSAADIGYYVKSLKER